MRLSALSTKQSLSVSEQAAAWLATLSDEAATPEDRRNFARWLVRSNLHVDEFLRLSTLTRRLERTSSWPEVDLERLIAEARLKGAGSLFNGRASAQAAELRLSERASRFFPLRRSWLATAAALILVSILLVLRSGWMSAPSTYETMLGELRSVTLEDGSIVELNAQSSIRARFTGTERRIILEGEAIFRVAPSPGRPFKVSTPFAEIVAIGTQFNVDSRSNKTVVTVIEGRVGVLPQSRPESSAALLGAGEQLEVDPGSHIRRAVHADPVKVTAWTARRLYFEDTPLSEAVSAFDRHSKRRIQIDDPDLANRRITGTFDSYDPSALVRFLGKYGDATIVETESGWKVSPAEPLREER